MRYPLMDFDGLLRRLLEKLEDVSATNEEIFDTECRERLGIAVMEGFARKRGANIVACDLGMATAAANDVAYSAILEFVNDANALAAPQLMPFRDRLSVI